MVQHLIITVRLWSSVSQIVLWNLYETKADDEIKWEMNKKKKKKKKKKKHVEISKKVGFSFAYFSTKTYWCRYSLKVPLICNE